MELQDATGLLYFIAKMLLMFVKVSGYLCLNFVVAQPRGEKGDVDGRSELDEARREHA